jgi:excisionase family DNA binding protein
MVSTRSTRTIERGTYSAPEAFERLGVGRTLGYQMIRDGRLPALRFGRRVVVPVAAIERLLADPSPIRNDAA